MSTARRFDRFLANISIRRQDADDAATKYNGVAGKLHGHYSGTEYTGSTAFLIGSYGKGTQVRPPSNAT